MAYFDLPLEELWHYQPARNEPDDFDAFWQQTLADTRQYPLEATYSRVDYSLRLLDSYDVSFRGYGGQLVKGWLLLPREFRAPLPCVVEYIGYGGGRGVPLDWLHWANLGYAHFIMDTRGQGSAWRVGNTPDYEENGFNPQYPGFMTRGILSPDTYYYRRVFADAVRAVEAAQAHEAVDAARIIVRGSSQGGGITLAVAGLLDGLKAVMPDVPFLCHYRRATQLTDDMPYGEIARYLKIHRDRVEAVFRTLSYFDGVNFAARAQAAALFSVGLMDTTCPPSTVFAAYNAYSGDKEIAVYEYNNHEGGETMQLMRQIQWLSSAL